MNIKGSIRNSLALGISLGLAACGGGGSSGSVAGTTGSNGSTGGSGTGSVNVALTDAPGDFSHLWVTVTQIAFHTDTKASWDSATDAASSTSTNTTKSNKSSSWQVYTLPSPVTVDLAALNNGALSSTSGGSLASLFQGINLPAGTYQQIRLFFDGASDSLDNSAQAINDSTGTALQWNDQVERYNPSTKTYSEYPLEMPFPRQGIQLNGTFTVSSGSTLSLALDFDLDRSVVQFKHAGQLAYTMKPVIQYFDLSKVGAITGQLSTTNLCSINSNNQWVPPSSTSSSTCAYNVIVKAEAIDGSDGMTRFKSMRATTLKMDGTGKFTLYPLQVNDANGNPIRYDVLIRGRNMQTMVIKKVPVTLGTNASNGTALPSSGSLPVTTASEYFANYATPLAPLTGGYTVFMQQDPAETVPYSVRYVSTDPFNGYLYSSEALVNAGLLTATYATGAITPTAVSGGNGNYMVGVNNVFQSKMNGTTSLSAPTSSSSGTASSPVTFTFNQPTLASGISGGTISGNIAMGTTFLANHYDNLQMVLVRGGSIVTTQNLSSSLSGATSLPYSLANVASGSTSTPDNGAYYYAYLRAWSSVTVNADIAAGKAARVAVYPVNGYADLRKTSTASLNVTLP